MDSVVLKVEYLDQSGNVITDNSKEAVEDHTPTATSDIDIVFTTDRPNLMTTSILKQDLEDFLGYQVNVIRLHSYLTPEFKARVEQEVIYVR